MIIFLFFLRVLFVLGAVAFAMLNAQSVMLDFYWYQFNAPLAQIIFFTLLIGYLLQYILPWVFSWKKKKSFLYSS